MAARVANGMAGVTAQGRKVLAKLAAGGALVPSGEGWRVGTQACAASVREALARLDLIEEARGGRWRISGPGMAWVRRAKASGEDGDGAGNRLAARAADHRENRDAAVQGARTVNRAENPLGWLLARGKITQRHYDAAERLRADFQNAGAGPRVTMAWDAAPAERGARSAPEGLLPGERVSAAKRRADGAFAAAGPGLSDVLYRLVCLNEGMETAEQALGWPARSGRVVLTLALDRVAEFYRV
ncbi:MAG: DUF6456 domain-containing protein [Pacificimonas sp.]|jgi:hypothetical protein|nr:DUF6456 domain-containing protein [Pacificimonas sp.]